MRIGFKKIKRFLFVVFIIVGLIFLGSCSIVSTTYKIGKGTVKATYKVAETVVKGTYGTAKIIYKVGGFTFKVVKAPLSWPFTRDGLESIDGLPPKEAVKEGRVKNSPYVVDGRRYVPMSVKEAGSYKEKGVASWYGYETRNKKGGHMTANGEAFDPEGLNAAHKYLPLPTFVKVTNLENNRSIILRVNDRGPFVKGRIIDLSAGAAKKLGYYKKGTARVLVEAIDVEA